MRQLVFSKPMVRWWSRFVNFSVFLSRARWRTATNPGDTLIPLCVGPCRIRRGSPWHPPFPPKPPQVGPAFPRSAPSSVLCLGFGADSDSSVPFMPSFGFWPSWTGLLKTAKTEVSGLGDWVLVHMVSPLY